MAYTKEDQLSKVKQPRRKKCKECKKLFTPTREMQSCCFGKCTADYAQKNLKSLISTGTKNRTKESNKKKKDFKDNDKTVLAVKVQKLANKYGRTRDILERGIGCITCPKKDGKMDGGHFLPTSSFRPIRYLTKQIKQQCVNCNRHNGGRRPEYTEVMIKMYGQEYVSYLESFKQGVAKYTVAYYQKYLKVMGKRLRKLEKRLP